MCISGLRDSATASFAGRIFRNLIHGAGFSGFECYSFCIGASAATKKASIDRWPRKTSC
jgi:hypothetical protein